MKISEIFYSLSGEGTHAGVPTVFVRLTGCNLRCTFCDTQYALEGGEELTTDEVLSRIAGWILGRWVMITGGEPLLQSDELATFVSELKQRDRLVEIETNGSIDPPKYWFEYVDCWSVDVKCPSSGSYGSFRERWLKKMRKRDQLKFVVGTQEDLDFVKGFLNGMTLKPTVLISPMASILLNKKEGIIEEYWNREWLQEVAEFCKEQNARMSLQLHKIIYGDRKGV